MESEICNCSSLTMKRSFSETHLKSLKCKQKELEGENRFTTTRFVFPQNARVETESECVVLRETVRSQQMIIQDLISELEEERNAASSAANEAMSMILRLQRDKAEIEMDARQFKVFAGEKMAHDQDEIFALGELLYKRDEAIMSLTSAMSMTRKFSESSLSPFATGDEIGPDFFRDSPKSARSFEKTEFSYIQENSNFNKGGSGSEVGDDMSDRIYTIDSVYQGASSKPSFGDERLAIPGESLCVGDIEIQKLYARLHALEADRESMRQAIVSIGTDKARIQLMKEIAQNLCKQMPLGRSMSVRKESAIGSFFFMSVFKWILPIFFWRKKACRCRYMFGLSAKNTGLLMLLECDPRVGLWRRILTTGM